MHFICPVCKKELNKKDNSLICLNGHCFDCAKSGYVNLLVNTKKGSKNHGDNKMMTIARRDFLEKGYYSKLKDKLVETAKKYSKQGDVLLDCGCGEGYYTTAIYENINNITMLGFDISKEELKVASKRNSEIEYAVASSFSIPVKNESVDMLFEIFSPYCEKEFLRVLKKNGIMIMVIPLENHLFSLKKQIYDKPYKNEVNSFDLNGFEFVENKDVKYSINLDNNEDISNLFMMTPYYYKTGKIEQARLKALQRISTEIEFSILVYKKI